MSRWFPCPKCHGLGELYAAHAVTNTRPRELVDCDECKGAGEIEDEESEFADD